MGWRRAGTARGSGGNQRLRALCYIRPQAKASFLDSCTSNTGSMR